MSEAFLARLKKELGEEIDAGEDTVATARARPWDRILVWMKRLPPMPRPSVRWITPAAVGLLLLGTVFGFVIWLALFADMPEAGRDASPVVRIPVNRPDLAMVDPEAAMMTDGTGASGRGDAGLGAPVPAPSPPIPIPGASPFDRLELAPAPQPSLVQETPTGPLPQIGRDGTRPWQAYARPFPRDDDRVRIAIVMSEMGLSGVSTGLALERLPPGVTLAFVPYAERLATLVEAARSKGHEVLVTVPLQPSDYPLTDPGPGTLFVGRDTATNLSRLTRVLTSVAGYVGVIDLYGTRFATVPSAMVPVLETVRDVGLLYVDGSRAPDSVLPQLGDDLGIPWARADRVIDLSPSRGAIDEQLAQLAAVAETQGFAVGLARPRPATIERLLPWMRVLSEQNMVVAPISALVPVPEMPVPVGDGEGGAI